ncbi:DUF4336 domain-containing protein [Chloropicon primus]|nr:DUF4336 domain-containing protein [Chloropicon primus]|eukprot:QDZ25933.1 DUF4336 domain-containing protein [Chloropicon primus]
MKAMRLCRWRSTRGKGWRAERRDDGKLRPRAVREKDNDSKSTRRKEASTAETSRRREAKLGVGVGESDDDYKLWFALPLQPGSKRITRRTELIKDRIWGFEQVFGTLDVIVNIRMTVVAMEEGGLFIHSPIAPTEECLRLVRELEEMHGRVKYIVLPTTAVEHKITFGPFAKRFPDAEIFAARRQWSFPLNLPLSFLGLFPRKATPLTEDGDYPWKSEFEMAELNLTVGIGPFVETAFFHKPTRTLLVTDTCFMIPETPPEVCEVDPTPLLKRARDDKNDGLVMAKDTQENRIKGWWKTILFSIFFQPSSVEFDPREWPTALVWRDDNWVDKVKMVQNKLLVAPILQVLVFSRDPSSTLRYFNRITSWPFKRIIPCHFLAPIEAGPRDLRQAARFLIEDPAQSSANLSPWEKLSLRTGLNAKSEGDYPESELGLLVGLRNFLTAVGVINSPVLPDEDK